MTPCAGCNEKVGTNEVALVAGEGTQRLCTPCAQNYRLGYGEPNEHWTWTTCTGFEIQEFADEDDLGSPLLQEVNGESGRN